jgi:hypothetical protein
VEVTSTVWCVCYLASGNATSYVGVVLVLDEWASVCRPARCGSMHISNPFWANDLEETGVQRENDGPHGPTVDETIITLDLYTVHNNVRRKVVGPALCLFSVDQEKKDGDCTCQLSSGGAGEGTLSIVRVPSTTLARPKSATLRTGRSSCARSTFYGIESVSEESGEKTQPRQRTSGLRSRCAMP